MKVESVMHAIMDYNAIKQMWKLTPFKDYLQSLGTQDLLGMIHEIARRRSKEELNVIIVLFWTAWHEGNKFVFESKI